MTERISFLTLFIMFFVVTDAQTQEPSWVVNTDTLDARYCNSMIIDNNNNIYIAAQGDNYVTLLKYDEWGNVKYAESDDIKGTQGNMCWGNDGRVYLAGSRRFELYNGDATIVVYDTDGTHSFTLSYDFMGKYDIFNDIFVDSSNYIYVCGHGFNEQFDQYGIVARYKPDGTLNWLHTYGFPDKDITLKFLNVDSNGNVHASGVQSLNQPGSMKVISLEYTNGGQLLNVYSDTFNGYSSYTTRFSLVDNEGSIYIGGRVNHDDDHIAFIAKVQEGILEWSQLFPDSHLTSEFWDATFNQAGNIVCCGDFTTSEMDAYLVEISSEGDVIRDSFYSNIPNQAETFYNIEERNGMYYCCGIAEWQGIATFAMFNSEFDLMWETSFNTPIVGYDKVDLIALDYNDNVIAGGFTAKSDYSCLIIKYSDPLQIHDQGYDRMVPVRVFPNPVESILNIQVVSTGEFKILNVAGDEVLNGLLNRSRINVTTLPKGIYFLYIYESGTQYYAKFVKQ